MHFYDPAGNLLSLVQDTLSKTLPDALPRLYNFGLYIPEITPDENLFTQSLGFVARTRRYLPDDMPLWHADKSFGFMLHRNRPGWGLRNQALAGRNSIVLVFQADDPALARIKLLERGLTAAPLSAQGFSFLDSFGIRMEVIARVAKK
jgi:hypothetical protein